MESSQECEEELTQKGEIVTRLQVKASAIGKILSSLEKKYDANSLHEMQPDAEYMKKSPSANLGHPKQRLHMKVSIQSIPPFNASKIRNSPSVELKSTFKSLSKSEINDNTELVEESEIVETIEPPVEPTPADTNSDEINIAPEGSKDAATE